MRTASLWGAPPSRFYRFLRRVRENTKSSHPSLGVLGCADGKFVLPAARAGFHVLAVDVDAVALFGGQKPWVGDTYVRMPGLAARLAEEGLENRVKVVQSDFTQMETPSVLLDGVFVSGAIQYSLNLPSGADEILGALLRFVTPRGLFYIDYMLPYETKYQGRPNCPTATWWKGRATTLEGWQVIHHRVLPPVLDHAHVEFPVDHYHQWGHLLLQRTC